MNIENLEINNFKSIGVDPPTILNIADISVLTGTNDTGKTSILSASYIGLNNIVNSGKQTDKLISKLVDGSKHFKGFKEERGKQVVKVGFKCTEEEVSNIMDKITKDDSLARQLEKLKLRKKNINADSISQFISQAIIYLEIPISTIGFESFDDFILYDHWLKKAEVFFGHEQIDDFSIYLLEVITSITFLEKSTKNMVCLFVPSVIRNEKEVSSQETVDEDENSQKLVAFFKEIASERGRRNGNYSKFISYCEILFPDLERIEINSPDSDSREIKEDLFLTWNQNGIEKYQPLSRSGGGVYNTLYLLAKLINEYSELNIVFIDEPEIGLHPMLQQRFIKLLRKISREFPIKWVIATHSPFILQNLKAGEKLYLVKHNGEQTNAKEIEVDDKEEVFLTLGAYLPLAFSSNGVLFVEGQSEVTVLKILLNKVGFDIEKERLLIIPLGGDNLFNIDPHDIKSLHEKSMVILDSDLPKSVEDGGNIKKIKVEYGESCFKSGVKFVMSKECRTLENMYPKEVMSKVLDKDEPDLEYGPFDVIPGITERNKVKIGESIANQMSFEQAKEFPLVQEIINWW